MKDYSLTYQSTVVLDIAFYDGTYGDADRNGGTTISYGILDSIEVALSNVWQRDPIFVCHPLKEKLVQHKYSK